MPATAPVRIKIPCPNCRRPLPIEKNGCECGYTMYSPDCVESRTTLPGLDSFLGRAHKPATIGNSSKFVGSLRAVSSPANLAEGLSGPGDLRTSDCDLPTIDAGTEHPHVAQAGKYDIAESLEDSATSPARVEVCLPDENHVVSADAQPSESSQSELIDSVTPERVDFGGPEFSKIDDPGKRIGWFSGTKNWMHAAGTAALLVSAAALYVALLGNGISLIAPLPIDDPGTSTETRVSFSEKVEQSSPSASTDTSTDTIVDPESKLVGTNDERSKVEAESSRTIQAADEKNSKNASVLSSNQMTSTNTAVVAPHDAADGAANSIAESREESDRGKTIRPVARCADGTYSFRSSTGDACAGRGGVAELLRSEPGNAKGNSAATPVELRTYVAGPRGGCYALDAKGKKQYVDKKYCT